PFEIDGAGTGHLRQAPGFFRVVAVLGHCDELPAGAGGEELLGDVRRQADDALGRLRELDAPAVAVDRGHPRERARRGGEPYERQETHGPILLSSPEW